MYLLREYFCCLPSLTLCRLKHLLVGNMSLYLLVMSAFVIHPVSCCAVQGETCLGLLNVRIRSTKFLMAVFVPIHSDESSKPAAEILLTHDLLNIRLIEMVLTLDLFYLSMNKILLSHDSFYLSLTKVLLTHDFSESFV